jgi:chromosome segregation ATPase
VEALPLELQRNYTLIRQLDENAEEIMQQVAAETKYLSTANLDIEERRSKLEHIGQLLNESLKKGEEKFALAKSTYDTVDRHCTRLDNDLQKIEDEQLIGPGRVSQKPSNIINNTVKQSDPSIESTPKRKRMKKEHKQETYFSTQDAIQYAKT